jgi:hypothetical protein
MPAVAHGKPERAVRRNVVSYKLFITDAVRRCRCCRCLPGKLGIIAGDTAVDDYQVALLPLPSL